MLGEGAEIRVRGEEATGLDDPPLPLVAVEIESNRRRHLHDRFDLREIRLGLGRLELLQRGLLRGKRAESIFVGGVGCRPESVLQCQGIVVRGRKFDSAVPAAAAAVHSVVADADGDADDALVIGNFLGQRAVVGDRLVGIDVVEAILHEVGPLHSRKHEGLLAVELLLHRVEKQVIPLRGRFGGGSTICNHTCAK